ncbi:hypothetical protein M427DRAFT_225441 [Gonapodya prolifera JEL478]|uniref:Sodium/calcium exchanger membrane region domain-containing protein n=1 Tax=Gonapodya prolifera (strain JEL478) TaxID=1344416 RepID=A0A139AND2_GONPJ|nr:hypothetical protein M427DRAFT_225441 [Gonapodya prolifera JEL478]|eukprot:KXS18252.1 hypothetical protein M427DRAFT_225441 [Gonapodya prolifera JEL478]
MSAHSRRTSQLDQALRLGATAPSLEESAYVLPTDRTRTFEDFLPTSAPAADPVMSASATPSLKFPFENADLVQDPSFFFRSAGVQPPSDQDNGPETDMPEGEGEDGDGDEEDNIQQRQEEYGHMLGMPKWKGSLVKKHRSIEDRAKADIHVNPFLTSKPSVSFWLDPGNILWSILFGWWLALSFLVVTVILVALGLVGTIGRWTLGACGLFAGVWWDLERCFFYAEVLVNLARYVFFPFGLAVERLRELPENIRLYGAKEDDDDIRTAPLSRAPSDYVFNDESEPLLSNNIRADREGASDADTFAIPTAFKVTGQYNSVGRDSGGASVAPGHLRPRSTPPPPHLQTQKNVDSHQYAASFDPGKGGARRASIMGAPLPRIQTPAVPFIHLHPGAFPEAPASFPGAGMGTLGQRVGKSKGTTHLTGSSMPQWLDGPPPESQRLDSFTSSMSAQPTETVDPGVASDGGTDDHPMPLPRRNRASLWRHALYLPEQGPVSFSHVVVRALLCVIVVPCVAISAGLCWLMVVLVPMTKLQWTLLKHLFRTPLRLRVRRIDDVQLSVASFAAAMAGIPTRSTEGAGDGTKPPLTRLNSGRPVTRSYANMEAEIILCIYNAVGWLYYKTVLDGVNIIIVNMFLFVPVTLFLAICTPLQHTPNGPFVLFVTSLAAVVPCAYLIGQAIASIAAQAKSVALGAVLNATFGSIVEILLYSFALVEGKLPLVEGGLIGSFLFGMLLLPGLSMAVGGAKNHEQQFNSRAAGITITLLWLGVIGAFTPTIFHRVFAKFNVVCEDPAKLMACYIVQPHPLSDPLYKQGTKPLMLICAAVLILTYLVGIVFTLRTHEKAIYSRKKDDRLPRKRVTGESRARQTSGAISIGSAASPQIGPSRVVRRIITPSSTLPASYAGSQSATPRRGDTMLDYFSKQPSSSAVKSPLLSTTSLLAGPNTSRPRKSVDVESIASFASSDSDDIGHDHPQWSRTKSTIILLVCTICFAGIGEILISSVDIVLDFVSPKFIGLTLFAIVPSITELYNGVAFALINRIQMSMEIANAYTAQVALLQIPVVVAFSAFWEWYHPIPGESSQGFTLVFPTLDCFAMMISLLLLSWVYSEGTANYFKGAMLLLTYFVIMSVFYFAPRESTVGDMF